MTYERLTPVSVYLKEPYRSRLKAEAEANKRSATAHAEWIIERYFNAQDVLAEPIRAGNGQRKQAA
jgi:hypothetical protein